MRRIPAGVVLIGGLIGWAGSPAVGRAGVWVTLAAGVPGTSAPSSGADFWFDSPHAPPQVAVTQLTGGLTAQAATDGGSVFFGGQGTPVLLSLAGGSAYLASGTPPATSLPTATASATAPVTGGSVPTSAALLGVNLAQPENGSTDRTLAVAATSSDGTALGSRSVTVPAGGWWVIGLTPDDRVAVDPTPPPSGGGDGVLVPPVLAPTSPTSPTSGGAVSTPEPSTLVLAAVGGVASGVWRRCRSRHSAA